MDTVHSLKAATGSKWTWLRRCWSLRPSVLFLATEVENLRVELQSSRDAHEATLKELASSKDGTRALIHFIKLRNRLNVDGDLSPIKSLLEK